MLLSNWLRISQGVVHTELISRLNPNRLLIIPNLKRLFDIDLVPLTILFNQSNLIKEAAELTRRAIHNGNFPVTLDQHIRYAVSTERRHKVLNRSRLRLSQPDGCCKAGRFNKINVRWNYSCLRHPNEVNP